MIETAPTEPTSAPVSSAPEEKTPNTKFLMIFGFVLSAILLIAGLTFFYLYIKRGTALNNLQDENEQLQEDLNAAEAEAEEGTQDLQDQITALEADLATAEAENTANEENLAKIKLYNDFLDYSFQLYNIHLGTGAPFTEDEYQSISEYAVATGNTELQELIDDAWTDGDIPVPELIGLVMDIITEDIALLV